jgi:DNA-directed RNA polymerase specialized sigma24 family protein
LSTSLRSCAVPTEVTIIRDYWPDAKEVLTDLQFQVVSLRDRQGHSWSEIAFVMGRDKATVRGHYQAAGKRMADFYEETGT